MGESNLRKTKIDLSQEERKALVCLLADEDPEIYLPVREKIISVGPDVCGWLENYVLDDKMKAMEKSISILNTVKRKSPKAIASVIKSVNNL